MPRKKKAPVSNQVSLPVAAYLETVSWSECVDLAEQAVAVSKRRRGKSFYAGLEEPKCGLEALAQQIAKWHVASLGLQDVTGVEWWVQVRQTDSGDSVL